MKEENARRQSLEQLHERRKQVVRLHKKGINIMQIVAMTGLSCLPFVRPPICLNRVTGPPLSPHCEDEAAAMGASSV